VLIKTYEFMDRPWHESIFQPYLDSVQLKSESILVAESFDIADYNERNPNNPLKVLDERITGTSMGFLGDVDQVALLTLIERVGQRLTENGVFNQLIGKSIHLENLRPQPEPEKPKVLGMKHVGVGFKVYGMSVGLSMLGFVLEKLLFKTICFIRATIAHFFIDLYF